MRGLVTILVLSILYPCISLGKPLATLNKQERIATVKAAMVYQLLNYVEYKGEPLGKKQSVICIHGDRILFRKLQEMTAEEVQLQLYAIPNQNAAKIICDVLYLGDKALPQEAKNLLLGQNYMPFIIGNSSEKFMDIEMVSLAEDEGRINLYVNLSNFKKAHLQVSPDLLDVARKIRK